MIFLKLGGSLITDKHTPHTPCLERLARIAGEISQYLKEHPDERMIIGHGSGSFGHVPANQYQTRLGVKSASEWHGFHEVWKEARALNLLVMDALIGEDIQAVSFPPSGSITLSSSSILSWNIEPIRSALGHGIVPVIFGDVAFDQALGGTILSTEELFHHLAQKLHPDRILLAGIEEGVWEDYPEQTRLIEKITPDSFGQQKNQITASSAPDVTGGMLSKVEKMLELVKKNPELQIRIFSGNGYGSILKALNGSPSGTVICR